MNVDFTERKLHILKHPYEQKSKLEMKKKNEERKPDAGTKLFLKKLGTTFLISKRFQTNRFRINSPFG